MRSALIICSAAALISALSTPASAQRRATSDAQPAASAMVRKANISVVQVRIPANQASATTEGPRKKGFGVVLKKAVLGDKAKTKVARKLLLSTAQQGVAGTNTLIVVIGGEDELTAVLESLNEVTRPITIAHADPDFQDVNYDNTALSSGMVGFAENVMVVFPRRGAAPRTSPDHVLSTKVLNPAIWNGLFATDGDALDLDLIASTVDVNGSDAEEPVQSAGRAAEPARATDGVNAGDIVRAKINGAKIYSEPSLESTVTGTATKDSELVVDSAPQNGSVRVEGAVSGWIKLTLLTKASDSRR